MTSFLRRVLELIIDPVDVAGQPSRTLCRMCRGITPDTLVSERGYAHYGQLGDLRKTWRTCSLCYIIYSYHIDRGKLSDQARLRLKIRPRNPTRMGDDAKLMFVYETPKGQETVTHSTLSVFIPIGDPSDGLGIPCANRRLSNTRSAATFEFLQSCIKQCASQHKCHLSSLDALNSRDSTHQTDLSSSPPLWPARLVYVGSFSGNTSEMDAVTLIDVGKTCPTYITLSHCWGSSKQPLQDKDKTTLRTIHLRRKSIVVKRLNANFRDAIEISRRLNVEYLWIDALCIIQDSPQDWQTESVKMAEIYQNSFLTISANIKGNGTGGCFNRRSIPRDLLSTSKKDMQSIEISRAPSGGHKTTLLFHHELISSEPRPLRTSPLKDRGWIYQERVLSPRTVHFTPTQVVWECREAYYLEDMLPSSQPTVSSTIWKTFLEGATSIIDPVEHWHREIICSNYSYRVFTKPEDRLVAIAGIAKIWLRILQDTYFAGLWKSHLAFGLAWHRDKNRVIETTPTTTRYPTWTWASHDGVVIWWMQHRTFQPDICMSLKGHNLSYHEDTPDSPFLVDGGWLTIDGRVSELTVDCIPDKGEVPAKMNNMPAKLFMDKLHLNNFPQLPARFEVLALGHGLYTDYWVHTYMLVIQPKLLGDSFYKRVGFAIVDFPSKEERTGFWDNIVPRTLHLL